MSAQRSKRQSPETAAAASTDDAAPGPAVASERRPFVLPPDILVKPVKQTLVQPDIPPNLTLPREVPLPAAILWSDVKLPPMRKRFVAPPEARPAAKTVQSVPENGALIALMQETRPGALNMAGVSPADLPKFHKAFVAPPSRGRQEPVRQVSQIGMLDPNATSGGNLISLPAEPVVSGTVALPPANQIASSDVATGGSMNGRGSGTGSGANNVSGHTGARETERSVAGDSGSGTASAPTKSAGGVQASVAMGTPTTAIGATGVWSATGSAGGPQSLAIAGLRRIELPKDGKFGAVISGSSASGSYPESAGALSGKIVYTVYIKVGLRKSWILQYCLPKDEKSLASGRTGVGIEAPWPFLMMRPDQGSASDPDYMILHGTITAAGRFDHLAVIFPSDYPEKELLLSSLQMWEFRPAAQDGVPVGVEALLIIPHQPE